MYGDLNLTHNSMPLMLSKVKPERLTIVSPFEMNITN
jgi:hypothetical protein